MQSQPSQAFKIIEGDVTEVLKTLPANFFDAVLSDPPYGISFMGKEWDRGVPSAATYRELSRVLKPGAFGLHFGGTRMWHRLAVNLEDAGFELRDTLMWLYGSGFPKSHNISKALEAKARTGSSSPTAQRKAAMGESYAPTPLAGTPGYGTTGNFSNKDTGSTGIEVTTPSAKQWDGYGTALKPAVEPALLVQKPLDKTFANNALTHGCGGLNIDGCRVGDDAISVHNAPKGSFAGGELERGSDTSSYREHTGRFPANLILDEEAGEALDAQSGTLKGGNFPTRRGAAVATYFAGGQLTEGGARSMGDTGGASRFFYCAKVSAKERNAGCDAFVAKVVAERDGRTTGINSAGHQAPTIAKNNHPTLKPIALTTYLARLLLVPARTDGQPRRILVPFSGAGSEMIGCLKAGWDEVWGIELDGAYVKIAEARVKHYCPGSEVLNR